MIFAQIEQHCMLMLCTGAGVLTYFAGAGVCSPYLCCKLLSEINEKTNFINEKVTMVWYFMLFLYNCDVRNTVKRVKILSENFIKSCDATHTIVNMKRRICVFKNN